MISPKDLDNILKRHPNVKTFIETGTFVGNTLAEAMPKFDRLFSIELSPDLHARCTDRFKGMSKIRLYQGSSRTMLAKMTKDAGDVPMLFWLDAHYSAGETAKEGKGYLEDRRPSANMDPYEVCAILMETVCS